MKKDVVGWFSHTQNNMCEHTPTTNLSTLNNNHVRKRRENTSYSTRIKSQECSEQDSRQFVAMKAATYTSTTTQHSSGFIFLWVHPWRFCGWSSQHPWGPWGVISQVHQLFSWACLEIWTAEYLMYLGEIELSLISLKSRIKGFSLLSYLQLFFGSVGCIAWFGRHVWSMSTLNDAAKCEWNLVAYNLVGDLAGRVKKHLVKQHRWTTFITGGLTWQRLYYFRVSTGCWRL